MIIFIALEGNIGAGKSTILKLRSGSKMCLSSRKTRSFVIISIHFFPPWHAGESLRQHTQCLHQPVILALFG